MGLYLFTKEFEFFITHPTNQVGHPKEGSLCSSRRGEMYNISTRLTIARGTWMRHSMWLVCQ